MARKMSTVQCAACGVSFEKETRRVKQTEKLSKKHTCSRSCASMITNAMRKAPPSTREAEHVRRDKEKFPEKTRARRLVRQALKTGKIKRPGSCDECGAMFDKKGNPIGIEAHHENHNKPYLLYWLCETCHDFHDKHKLTGYGTDYSEQINDND